MGQSALQTKELDKLQIRCVSNARGDMARANRASTCRPRLRRHLRRVFRMRTRPTCPRDQKGPQRRSACRPLQSDLNPGTYLTNGTTSRPSGVPPSQNDDPVDRDLNPGTYLTNGPTSRPSGVPPSQNGDPVGHCGDFSPRIARRFMRGWHCPTRRDPACKGETISKRRQPRRASSLNTACNLWALCYH